MKNSSKEEFLDKLENSNLIYVDPDFVSSVYEEVKGLGVPTTVSKAEGGRANVGLGIFTAGIQAIETRHYDVSIQKMVDEVLEKLLEEYSFVEEVPNDNSAVFWITAQMLIGGAGETRTKNGEVIGREYKNHFKLENEDLHLPLLTAANHFKFGYNMFLDQVQVLYEDLRVNVTCLVKLMSRSKHLEKVSRKNVLVASPLLIYEHQTSL